MGKRLENIQNIKCLMMLAVVLYHSCMFFTGNCFGAVTPIFDADYLVTFALWLNTFHVATFTMASGYIFYYLKFEMGRYTTDIKLDFLKRFKRLILPYLFTCLIWVIPFYIAFNGFDIKMILYKYILGYAPSQLWFLLMLFWVFGIFRLLHKRIPICKAGIFVMAAVSIVGGGILDKVGLGIYQISTAVHYCVFFYLGGFLYCKYGSSGCNAEISDFARRQDIRKGCAYAAISLVGYAISGILNDYDGIIVKVSRYGLEMIVSIAGVLMVYFLITGFEKRFKTLKKIKIFNTLSRDSFGIYLFHQQIIYLTIIFLNGNLYPFVQTIVSMAVALCIAETIVLLLRSWKITKMLFGL